MGVYYFACNLDLGEYIDAHDVADAGYQFEQQIPELPIALWILLAPDRRIGEIWGRWAGHRVAILTDSGNALEDLQNISPLVRPTMVEYFAELRNTWGYTWSPILEAAPEKD